jgi:hypothetical protein
LVGGGYIDNPASFRIRLIHQASQNQIDVKENIIKPRIRKNWVMGIEYLQFRISQEGEYILKLENPEELIV